MSENLWSVYCEAVSLTKKVGPKETYGFFYFGQQINRDIPSEAVWQYRQRLVCSAFLDVAFADMKLHLI